MTLFRWKCTQTLHLAAIHLLCCCCHHPTLLLLPLPPRMTPDLQISSLNVYLLQASSTPAPPQTYQASTPAAPPQTANQVSSAPAPPKIVPSHRKQVDKPNTMPSSSVHARLHVVLSWVDKKQNDRIHAVISVPSGTHLLKKAEVVSTDSGSQLSVSWYWPQIMLDPVKMFAHSRFHETIQAIIQRS